MGICVYNCLVFFFLQEFQRRPWHYCYLFSSPWLYCASQNHYINVLIITGESVGWDWTRYLLPNERWWLSVLVWSLSRSARWAVLALRTLAVALEVNVLKRYWNIRRMFEYFLVVLYMHWFLPLSQCYHVGSGGVWDEFLPLLIPLILEKI